MALTYQLWKAPQLRSHFRSDNSQVYLPTVRGTARYAQFILEFNPDLIWDEANNRVEGEIWCEAGDAVRRGGLWFAQQKPILVFIKRREKDVGFTGPVCLVRPGYFADMSSNAPAVQLRDTKLKTILPPSHRGYRDIGGYIILQYVGPA